MTTQFPETFDPETQEGNSWELLPAGEYVAQVVEASVQQPNSGDGFYLALTWKIAEGEFEGRQVWQNITLVHSNEQAQTIGRKTLKDLCVALDVNEQVNDAKVFLFKPARIRARDRERQTGTVSRQEPDFPHPAAGGKTSGTGTTGTGNNGRQSLIAGGGNESGEVYGGPRRPRSMACTTLVIGKGLGRRLWERRRPLIGRCSSCVHISGKHSPR